MIPKFRAWGVERYPGLKQPAPKMHRNVSVVTTYPEGITFVLTDFSMWGDDEYSGSIIDDAILMQSTGLKDKNGQEIFEGDILTDEGCELDEFLSYVYVIFKDGMWYCMPAKSEGYSGALNEFNEYYSAVGNIYENSDILEDINETL